MSSNTSELTSSPNPNAPLLSEEEKNRRRLGDEEEEVCVNCLCSDGILDKSNHRNVTI